MSIPVQIQFWTFWSLTSSQRAAKRMPSGFTNLTSHFVMTSDDHLYWYAQRHQRVQRVLTWG
jgi:hypothetical protein